MMRLSAAKEFGEEGGISKYSRKGVFLLSSPRSAQVLRVISSAPFSRNHVC